ncbi:uncharacterized protein P884DRAFT_213085 [Thermothelomyces heterothallicus CBS 202.75]|uniref:uncharacterized protein n=1 Tax=Thermothelomyces heterothallicus CBS 202.75 TaxID=1149848 RepID=UPI003742D998
MSCPLRIPKPQTPLHLYRHLLRESSYLPPLVRQSADKLIKARFRKDKGDAERGPKHVRNGLHELRVLRAANSGDMARMRRVMLRAFGRIGRRRRELVSRLVQRDMPTNTKELAEYVAEMAPHAEKYKTSDWLDDWDVEKLRTFALSQINASLNNSPKMPITINQVTPEKKLPKENAWGRPLPIKLARTKLKNMWKSAADKIMPPLPVEEWKALQAIAEGTAQGWLPPPRRALAKSMSEASQAKRNWDWQSYAIKPVAVVDRPANRRNKLLTGAVDDNTPTGDPRPIGCHNYTRRAWRRMFEYIWNLTATMKKQPDGKGWDIRWGKLDHQPASATAGMIEFFNDFPYAEKPKTRGKHNTT